MLNQPENVSPVPQPRREIADRDDIYVLVNSFYTRALSDEALFPYFLELRFGELERYIPKMCDFWDTALFGTQEYRQDPLYAHLHLHALYPLKSEHFEHWIGLWIATIDSKFTGAVAHHAKKVATQIACTMHKRIIGTQSPILEDLLQSFHAMRDH
ncbi:group III truncated hemoglobin [Mycobacteroides chelonae]|jgi:truncated hemoglobin YjbI|uniref:group III truncated hemoglobin n=1 Tax=Mycobacteroides chelonae TaxID=1774 RepID=UPI0039E8ECAA